MVALALNLLVRITDINAAPTDAAVLWLTLNNVEPWATSLESSVWTAAQETGIIMQPLPTPNIASPVSSTGTPTCCRVMPHTNTPRPTTVNAAPASTMTRGPVFSSSRPTIGITAAAPNVCGTRHSPD